MNGNGRQKKSRTGFWVLMAAVFFFCALSAPEDEIPGEAVAVLAVAGVLCAAIGAVAGVRGVARKNRGGGEMKDKKKQRISLIGILIALNLITGVVYLLPDGTKDALALFIAGISVVIVVTCLFLWVRVTLSKKKQREDQAFPGRSRAGVPAGRADSGAGDRPLPTAPARTFSPAIYDENLREDAAARERQRRLEQLDGFYRNGMIDREEYRKLRRRYENS